MKRLTLLILIVVTGATTNHLQGQDLKFSDNPNDIVFHTEDINSFWKTFDLTYPKLESKVFQESYIDQGSKGLKGFVKYRIESGKNMSKTVKSNLSYYQSIRESSLSIDKKRERFYECFHNLKKVYPEAVFPDVYFVIGAKNSGGTAFSEGLIIGAEMFGEETKEFKPTIDINYVDEVVAHELVHFQQKYTPSNTLLAQCIKEGAADFICELIAGGHNNGKIYEYGYSHTKELWNEFITKMNQTSWTNWLYYSKDKSKPKDLGYFIGYKITKSYYDKSADKMEAVKNILNIQDFNKFLADSGYNGE